MTPWSVSTGWPSSGTAATRVSRKAPAVLVVARFTKWAKTTVEVRSMARNRAHVPSRVPPSELDRDITGGIALDALLRGWVVLDLWEVADAMSLEAAMYRDTRPGEDLVNLRAKSP